MYSFSPHLLSSDELRLSVLPSLGCRWTSFEARVRGAWTPLLWPSPSAPEQLLAPYRHGSYLMAPWCNRIPAAKFRYAGRARKLRSNFPDGTAIHGDVLSRLWDVEQATATDFSAVLDTRLLSDFNFPFPMTLRHTLALQGATLRAELTITNVGDAPCPAGFGFHPFFSKRLPGDATALQLTVPAKFVYPARVAVPVAPAVPVDARTSLVAATDLSDRVIDACYRNLSGPVRLAYASGLTLSLHLDPALDHVYVYTPLDAPDVFCVEPMTMAVNGFNLLAEGWPDTGVKELAPGETWSAGFSVEAG